MWRLTLLGCLIFASAGIVGAAECKADDASCGGADVSVLLQSRIRVDADSQDVEETVGKDKDKEEEEEEEDMTHETDLDYEDDVIEKEEESEQSQWGRRRRRRRRRRRDRRRRDRRRMTPYQQAASSATCTQTYSSCPTPNSNVPNSWQCSPPYDKSWPPAIHPGQCPCGPADCGKTWSCIETHAHEKGEHVWNVCKKVFNGTASAHDEECCWKVIEPCRLWKDTNGCVNKLVRKCCYFKQTAVRASDDPNCAGVTPGTCAASQATASRPGKGASQAKLLQANAASNGSSLDASLSGKRVCS